MFIFPYEISNLAFCILILISFDIFSSYILLIFITINNKFNMSFYPNIDFIVLIVFKNDILSLFIL